MFRLILILNCAILGVFSATFGPKCKLNTACLTKHTTEIYKSIFEDETNQLDPLYQKLIQGNLATIKYSLTESTTTGFKKCTVKRGDLDLKNLVLEVDLYCPEFHAEGNYEIDGFLIVMPVEGKGAYTLDCKAYDLSIRMNVSLIPKDDKHHIHIDSFNIKSVPLEGVVYNFTNLFNGQKDLADSFLKFVNDNWKEVANELQGPMFRTNFRKIIKATNKFFKEQTLENFIEV